MARNDFDEYYGRFQKAREAERAGRYEEALTAYLEILDEYEPAGTVYYERPAILLEQLGRFDEAIEVCNRAIRAIEREQMHANPDEFQRRIDRLREKQARAGTPKPVARTTSTTAETTATEKQPQANSLALPRPKENVKFPDRYVSVSFAPSRSQMYPAAVALAKMAPLYFEETYDGKLIHQAVYSDKPDEYLQFIKLYEMVANWKSCIVVINGEVVDRKIIGGLNYCYGDKCRSGNPEFCYGASPFTENPFGCHRLQTSAWNHPWWSIGAWGSDGLWHIDKQAILRSVIEYSQPYRLCPAFSWERVAEGLKSLPDVIDPRNNPEWVLVSSRAP